MIHLSINAIAMVAPGMPNWAQAQQMLSGKQSYHHAPTTKKLTTFLPANEARRCSRTISLALSSITQLLENSNVNEQEIRYIFSSCNGDLSIFHHISTALSQTGRPVSPTKFHNSVHNAPAGYCAIALGAQTPSTSITAYQDSVANALLEAAVQVASQKQACLLTGYDEIPPEPLLSLFPIADDFAYSLLISPAHKAHVQEPALCRLSIAITQGQKTSTMDKQAFEKLRTANPQAKILPLLEAIAKQEEKTIILNDNQQQIAIHVSEFLGKNP